METKLFTDTELNTRTKIILRTSGPEDGIPVVALHGWLDNAASFDPLAHHLKNIRLLALDLPGHGLSEHRPEAASYHFVEWVMDLAACLEALALPSAHFIGHSMGASILSLFAGTFPEKVKSMVLLDGLQPLIDSEENGPQRLAHHIKTSHALKRRSPPSYASIDDALAARLAAGQYFAPENLRPMIERGLSKENQRYQWRTDQRLMLPSPLRFTKEQVLSFLRCIKAPVLMLKARHGLPMPPDGYDYINAVSNREFRELAGGHHLHIDEPKAIALLIQNFFQTGKT